MGLGREVTRVGSLVVLLAACPGKGEGTTKQEPTVPIDLQTCRELPEAAAAAWVEGSKLEPTGQSTQERIATAGARTWMLALDLLGATPSDRSVAASPTSMSLALAMTEHLYEGRQCGEEILAHMHYAETGDALYNTLGASIRELEGRALPQGAQGEDPVVISLSQSIWDLDGGRVANPILGGTLHKVTGDLDAVRTVMNCVIEAQSQGLLVDFIPVGFPKGDTTSFDVNVAYLQAPWTHELVSQGDLELTKDDGSTVVLPAMGATLYARLHQDEQRWAIELPVRGGQLAVLLVLPAPEPAMDSTTDPTMGPSSSPSVDLGTFTAELTSEVLETIRDDSSTVLVDLTMPKVDIPSETIDYYDLLGFECELYTLRTILHGAAVQMDEKGIKAVAATVAESWETGGPEAVTFIQLDRPFLFFVYDQTTHFVLYSGRFAG